MFTMDGNRSCKYIHTAAMIDGCKLERYSAAIADRTVAV